MFICLPIRVSFISSVSPKPPRTDSILFHPANQELCTNKENRCTTEGDYFGSFKFASGPTTLAMRIKLSDPAASSGAEIQLWMNGKPVMEVQSLDLASLVFQYMRFHSSFGK